MLPTGPTWYKYFTDAVEKGMTLDQARDFCKEFGPDDAQKALEKLEKYKK